MYNQSNYVTTMSGLNNNPTVTSQLKKHPTFKKPFDYEWHEKQSPNGEFKYGLFECCSGPNGTFDSTCAIIFCFIPWPGWFLTASVNGELAGIIGKKKLN
jgi:hypothetical protein